MSYAISKQWTCAFAPLVWHRCARARGCVHACKVSSFFFAQEKTLSKQVHVFPAWSKAPGWVTEVINTSGIRCVSISNPTRKELHFICSTHLIDEWRKQTNKYSLLFWPKATLFGPRRHTNTFYWHAYIRQYVKPIHFNHFSFYSETFPSLSSLFIFI